MPVCKYVLILLSTFLLYTCGPELTLPQRGICAHRGANNTHPENTIAAFKEAIRLGVHMIEFDIQLSADSELVVMHDKTLDRTTNGSGKISDYTLAELKQLDAGSWKHEKFKNERIPTLGEVLESLPLNIWLNIHLKGGAQVAEQVALVIIENQRIHQSVIACKPEAIRAIKKIDKRIMVCNMDRRENSDSYVAETIELKADFIQLKERADSQLPQLVPKLKQNGIRINYYGTNSAGKLKELIGKGIDFPLCDNVSEMMTAAREIGINAVTPLYGE